MKTFDEYVIDWWHDYLEEASDETLKSLMEQWIGDEETIEDYIPDDYDNPYDYLYAEADDPGKIYSEFFGVENDGLRPDDIPDTQSFLTDMFMECVAWPDYTRGLPPSFAREFVEDMAYNAADYDDPAVFFKDLAQGGCISGLIGMLIYNSDCKDIYVKHIDDMEAFKEALESEMGGAISNRHKVHHYVFLCWLCYEELGYMIARTLFPEVF